MNDNAYLSGIVCENLETNSPVVLASIVRMEGSSPREAGTKMVIASGGKGFGTIGGGVLEAAVLVQSRKVLTDGSPRLVQLDMDEKSDTSQGMICGGKVDVLLDIVKPTGDNLELFKEMRDYITRGESMYLVTALTGEGEAVGVLGHCLLFRDGTALGDPILAVPEAKGLKEELHNISSTTILTTGATSFVIDPIRKSATLYCFGAGHVAVPTAHIAAMVGFNVVVIDDRAEFANEERFPDAKVMVIDDFGRALDGLQIDADSYVVIVTRGHKFDRVVLQQALKTEARYIGMIGSKTKRDAVYRQLTADGLATAQDIARVHSPIGLSIGAETPDEIAVSILAELVQERHRQAG